MPPARLLIDRGWKHVWGAPVAPQASAARVMFSCSECWPSPFTVPKPPEVPASDNPPMTAAAPAIQVLRFIRHSSAWGRADPRGCRKRAQFGNPSGDLRILRGNVQGIDK